MENAPFSTPLKTKKQACLPTSLKPRGERHLSVLKVPENGYALSNKKGALNEFIYFTLFKAVNLTGRIDKVKYINFISSQLGNSSSNSTLSEYQIRKAVKMLVAKGWLKENPTHYQLISYDIVWESIGIEYDKNDKGMRTPKCKVFRVDLDEYGKSFNALKSAIQYVEIYNNLKKQNHVIQRKVTYKAKKAKDAVEILDAKKRIAKHELNIKHSRFTNGTHRDTHRRPVDTPDAVPRRDNIHNHNIFQDSTYITTYKALREVTNKEMSIYKNTVGTGIDYMFANEYNDFKLKCRLNKHKRNNKSNRTYHPIVDSPYSRLAERVAKSTASECAFEHGIAKLKKYEGDLDISSYNVLNNFQAYNNNTNIVGINTTITLSCAGIATLLGYESATMGYKIQKELEALGLLDIKKRHRSLGSYSDKDTFTHCKLTGNLSSAAFYDSKNDRAFIRLSNQIIPNFHIDLH